MPSPRELCRVIVLGSTGSIGTQTLQVIEHLNDLHRAGRWPRRFDVVGLAARRNFELLNEQAARFDVRQFAIGEDSDTLAEAKETWTEAGGSEHGVRFCQPGLQQLIEDVDCDLVVAAMSGTAGLAATLRALELGRTVALANKEALVAAGALMVEAARASGARLLPIDSEHSGLWQALGCGATPITAGATVARVILTASGGPFRAWTAEQIAAATPEQALNHPTWRMGLKVTIDSASLMNKALEVIEAHWLFGLDADRIQVLLHPQSIVHALVEFTDGSTVAQLGAPDMRCPIQYALSFPGRAPGICRRLNWAELSRLDFEPVDHGRFPALELAYRAIREGGAAGAVLNAANEAAVDAFVNPRGGTRAVRFPDITTLTRQAMDALGAPPLRTLADVLDADRAARAFVRERLAG
jgi:1-deoxy-D-xylulose-5-phosphate reductoisomerase